MYGRLCKDVVMKAVQWLIENNPFYKDIQLNDFWDEQWMQTELGDLLVTSTENGDREVLFQNENEEINMDKNDNIEDAFPIEESEVNIKPGDTQTMITPPNQSTAESIEKQKDEQELKEDQAAADRNAEMCGQQHSSTLQIENIEDAVYSVAPGENNVPKYILMDNDFEVLAFPDLFPTGKGGYNTNEPRETQLSLRRYYQQRILNVDGRFARNIEYIAAAQYSTELKQLKSDANIALRITRGRKFRGHTVNAGMLKNPHILHDMVRQEQAYKFLKNVCGSPPYWKNQLLEVLAMIRTLDIPTWFLTLSAADLHWPELVQAVGRQYGQLFTREDVMKMDWQTKADKLMSNPVTACEMFQHRVDVFFSEYILSNEHPLGHVHDYVIKIEFQERGSPHAHCLLWVKNSPRIDVDSDEEVCNFIDEYISGEIPDNEEGNEEIQELVKKLETHSHSAYCRRNSSCRFGFPKAPSPKTLIARPPEDEIHKEELIKASRDVLGKVHDALDVNQNISMEELLQKSNVSEQEYLNSLKIARHGKNIVLKRSPTDVLTNGCNQEVLRLWQANIDFQYVIDAYSTVMYVIGYMMKSEKAMGEILKRVAKESQQEDIAEQLKKIGAAFIGKRVVGLPESVMRQNSMWLIKKSVKVIFVNPSCKAERATLPKSAQHLANMEDDDENIFMNSIHDRYAARPDHLNDKCLAYFAINYDTAQ